MSEDVENHNIEQKSHKKLEKGINSRKKNSGRGENPKRHLPWRLTLIINIFNSIISLNYILRKCTGAKNLQNNKKRLITLYKWLI